MARNKMSDLRDHLFETLEALKDDDKPMDIERARAISDVAQAIINSAKVEVDLVKAVGGSRPGSVALLWPAGRESRIAQATACRGRREWPGLRLMRIHP